MFKLMDKKIFANLHKLYLLSWSYEGVHKQLFKAYCYSAQDSVLNLFSFPQSYDSYGGGYDNSSYGGGYEGYGGGGGYSGGGYGGGYGDSGYGAGEIQMYIHL